MYSHTLKLRNNWVPLVCATRIFNTVYHVVGHQKCLLVKELTAFRTALIVDSHILMKFDCTKLKRKLWTLLESKNNSFAEGFPGGSAGKESACNAGDPSSIPRSGISARKGIGYPLQYPWASLVAQLVKNPPAMQETWVQSLG